MCCDRHAAASPSVSVPLLLFDHSKDIAAIVYWISLHKELIAKVIARLYKGMYLVNCVVYLSLLFEIMPSSVYTLPCGYDVYST